jgi:hypothetical protein
LFSRLVFPFGERVDTKTARSIMEEFGAEFGSITSIPVDTQFLKVDGSWLTVETVFDTGANMSLLPRYAGVNIGIVKYVSSKLSGILRKEECAVPIRIAKVMARLLDDQGNTSPAFELWTAFAERDDVPSLLGTKGIMDNFKLEADPVARNLYLTWKE